jgi:hypothetical protein
MGCENHTPVRAADISERDMVNLTPYLAAFHKSLLSQCYKHEEVRLTLKKRTANMNAYGFAEMSIYSRSSNISTTFYEFLNGKLLENSSLRIEFSKYNFMLTFDDFMTEFEQLMYGFNVANGTRTTTKPRDYVLSIWVDCDQYKVP